MRVEVTDYRKSQKESVKLGSFTVIFPDFFGMSIREMSYFEKGSNKWISFPQKPYESNGEKKYFGFVHFHNPSDFRLIQTKIIEALKIYLKANPEANNIPSQTVQITGQEPPF